MDGANLKDDVFDLGSYKEQGEELIIDALQKRSFPEIFFKEGEGEWLDFSMDDAYVHAAKILVRNIIDGNDYDPFYGPVVLYLVRHWLETKLKLVCFHARWLQKGTWTKNASDDEIQAIPMIHPLGRLFANFQSEVGKRLRGKYLDNIDVTFVEDFVKKLDNLDPDGERFQYSVKQIEVRSEPIKQFRLRVHWQELLNVVEHCESVLNWIDGLLLNTHGMNQDAEADMAP